MFFEPIRDIANKVINLNENRLMFEVLNTDKKLQKEILDLNRWAQLFREGINSEGVLLSDVRPKGGYTSLTIQLKREKLQRTDHVTLRDTGEFYDSFRLKIGHDFFEIDANPNKDETNLFDEWGADILGLTDESKEVLTTMLIPLLQNKLNTIL